MAMAEAFKEAYDWTDMEVLPYYIPPRMAVDIDEPLDLEWARFLLSK